ncbi:hypothetical protein P152DRAFT_515351 [Eremomyces bilateralis CBS 781.70]|uniref:Azaphilone pigments biosynthesis cluster protein L N-terminal domain-containing protein n=1 Tax=Eremomyces bilateralis CBS 781.70 TaxID=1392243 RepID=A0A6G1FZ29_9PEZI|nr:uncharacterized protein P152DRAFT_515351 [Eremomyces bilateralis CBS 781.70]KAF1810926.1 hypothetical protein P152DRAFT_515351 [Eremomyces bilateralis CBS 781.70]
MDPLSITASTLGITQFAISSIVHLHDFLDNLAEAKEVVRDIASNLEGVQRSLTALEELTISDRATYSAAKVDLEKTGVVEAVNNCGQACAKFTDNLKRWTKHSGATQLSLRDRFSVGVWNREKIRTFRMQVQSCQATVHFAATSTQLIVQLRSEQTSETDREKLKGQLQALEAKIQEHMYLTKKQQGDAQSRVQGLQEEPDDEEDGGAQRTLAIQEVEEQTRRLEADQVSSAVIFSQVRSKRTGQDIVNIITSDDSRALVGLPEGVVGKVNQRIRDVTTQRNSAAAVGVFDKDVDIKDFFKQ